MASEYRVVRNYIPGYPPRETEEWFTIEKFTKPWWSFFDPRWVPVTQESYFDRVVTRFDTAAAAVEYAKQLAFYEDEGREKAYVVWHSEYDR